MTRLKKQANSNEDIDLLINRLKQFENEFKELDAQLQAVIPQERQAELDEAVGGFENLRDNISDLEFVGSKILDSMYVR